MLMKQQRSKRRKPPCQVTNKPGREVFMIKGG